MKYLFILILSHIYSSLCAQPLVHTFYFGQSIDEYITQGWVKSDRTLVFTNSCNNSTHQFIDFDYLLFSRGSDSEATFQINLNTPNPHTQLQISYLTRCNFRRSYQIGDPLIDVLVDGNVVIQNQYGINNSTDYYFCDDTIQRNHVYNIQNQAISHNSSQLDLKFKQAEGDGSQSHWCYITEIKVEYSCFDQIGTLTDGNGDTLMENNCTAFVENDEQRFNFSVSFQDPYQFATDCFDLGVQFSNTTLEEGTQEMDQWQFDTMEQEIKWTIRLDDFIDKYNCSDSQSTNSTYIWLCNFQVDIYYNSTVQLEYKAKLQVTLDRGANATADVTVLANEVEGQCCENQLNVTTVLNICENSTCLSYQQNPYQFERGEPFYVEQSITNLEFDHYYLKYVQAKLGPYILQVLEYDGSIAGKLRLKLQANIAMQGSVLQVISQLHNSAYSPLSGSNRRRILNSDEEVALEQLESNQYKIASYEQIDVVDYGSQNMEKEQQNNTESTIVRQEVQDQQIQQSNLILLGIISILVLAIITILVLTIAYRMKKNQKQSKESKKEEEKYNQKLEQQTIDPEQHLVQQQ